MTRRSTAKPRTPRGTLNPERILATAVGVIDAEGVEKLTFGRLAADLDVTPMSIYTYFRDKNALLRAAADLLYERLRLPERVEGGDDVEYIKEMLRAYFDVLTENPLLLGMDASWEGITTAEARFFEELYAAMYRLGYEFDDAIGHVATFVRYVMGSAYAHLHRHHRDGNADYWDRYRASFAVLSPREFPTLNSVASRVTGPDQKATFEYGLELLLGSLDRDHARGSSGNAG